MSNPNSGVKSTRGNNNASKPAYNAGSTVDQNDQQQQTEQTNDRASVTMQHRGWGRQADSRNTGRGRGSGQSIFGDAAITPYFDTDSSHATHMIHKGMSAFLEDQNKRLAPNDQFKLSLFSRQQFNLPYDVITLHRHYVIDGGSYPIVHSFIIGPSRSQLADISHEDERRQPFHLPAVVGDNPGDRSQSAIVTIRAKLYNAVDIFGGTPTFSSERIIEQQYVPTDDDEIVVKQLMHDAAESIKMCYLTLMNPEVYDWQNAMVGTNGRRVHCAVDYNPQPLFTETGHPIFRQITLTISMFRKEDGDNELTREPVVTLSAFLDAKLATDDVDSREFRPVMPVLVISDVKFHIGANRTELFLVALANMTQLPKSRQYLPILDYRRAKLDPFNNLGNITRDKDIADYLEVKEGVTPLASFDDVKELGKDIFLDEVEMAIDCSRLQGNTGWIQDILDMARSDSPVMAGTDTLFSLANTMAPLFQSQYEKVNCDGFIYDEDHPVVGGYFNKMDPGGHNSKRDTRNVTLFTTFMEDMPVAMVDAYDFGHNTQLPPAEAASNQLAVIEAATGSRPTVTTYHQRFTFRPDMLGALATAFDDVGIVAPLDGGRGGDRASRQDYSQLRGRGVAGSRRNHR